MIDKPISATPSQTIINNDNSPREIMEDLLEGTKGLAVITVGSFLLLAKTVSKVAEVAIPLHSAT